ncbi:MAG: peptidoglycan-binding protein [candidate division KSB1 bacterium]|nr:peptidoglycan-binding protein [candidate division KSB1 bacterium]MDZ7364545.1 peptidoglycan-binding protein [candidate division KSB1 bacterium]MDZ7405752.1 peptidoglycan-binding protein [candidate division KSB1 bacterium]
MKRIISIAFAAVLTLSFAAMGLAQQATKPMEKQQASAPAKAMTATTAPLKLSKDEIMKLQNALITAKVYKGKASGILDTATKRALRRYQQDNKLKVTGEPNEETLNKLGVAYAMPQAKPAEHSMEKKAEPHQKQPQSNHR